MNRVRLTLEYDGTGYVGWQIQPNGLSVQEVVEQALKRLLEEEVRVHSSGRTDAGVHARGMVVHFDTHRSLPVKAYREGLNHFLPDDVAVISAEEVDSQFHARYSAQGKWYRYSLLETPVRRPLEARFHWLLKEAPDLELMREASRHFVGEHDFSAFCASGSDVRTTVRRIDSCEWLHREQTLIFDVMGSGFLKNMIRIMVGTLVDIGTGRYEPGLIKELLASGDRTAAGITAPPQGLCLMKVYYGSSQDPFTPPDRSPSVLPCDATIPDG